jgi:hypothetical protein
VTLGRYLIVYTADSAALQEKDARVRTHARAMHGNGGRYAMRNALAHACLTCCIALCDLRAREIDGMSSFWLKSSAARVRI